MTLPWSALGFALPHQVITRHGKHDTGTFHLREPNAVTATAGFMKARDHAIEFVLPSVLFLVYQAGSRSRAGAAVGGSV